MKYIMIEAEDGRRIPVIFPDCLTHSIVNRAMACAILVCTAKRAVPVSAGFVSFEGVTCSGESESLGGLKSRPGIDAARIKFSDAVAYKSDDIVKALSEMDNDQRETKQRKAPRHRFTDQNLGKTRR